MSRLLLPTNTADFAVYPDNLLYQEYTGERPTTVTNPDNGEMISSFDMFVEQAFFSFWPEEEVPPGSLQTAIREAARFERGTEEFTPPEL